MNNSIKSLIISSIVMASLSLTSCNERQKLSQELSGSWSGQPETLTDTSAARATMTRILAFTPTGDAGEGDVTITAMITVENTMPATDSIVTPLTITASGVATITGVYQAKDDDDIIINLDTSSLTVNVDPDAVQMNYDILSQNDDATMAKLRGAAAILADQQINHAARVSLLNLATIEDIHVNNNLMKCEIGNRDIVFRREALAHNL